MGTASDSTTYDIVLAANAREVNAPVLVTVVGRDSADKMIETLSAVTLFQCEGLKPFARAVNRDVADTKIEAPMAPAPSAAAPASDA